MTNPVMITTWPFGLPACRLGIERLRTGASALDAIEAAANLTEDDPDVHSVGTGGLPNAEGVVELDAAIMDGRTHGLGAVAALTRTSRAISVARRVMERTPHAMLAGDNAVRFARNEGFPESEQLTEAARAKWLAWKEARSAADVAHFEPLPAAPRKLTPDDHDTIGLCALDRNGDLAAGCTTSGMAWKLPGRVGDSPIVGAGLYVDNEIGAAAATGHGDEMVKALLCYRVVMLMGSGLSPDAATVEAIRYLLRKRPPETHGNYGAGVIALSRDGRVAAAGTLSGYKAPDRRWTWASAGPGVGVARLHEGVYVTLNSVVPTLPS
ncbi:MAG TPA: N(4)-(beta-N-acetylglucosaminyl)-L-asparaginase [Chthonomonadaceae bacterium]|nr:N(4)-(beta-N-acetylglucosaminyl)-L-asparaginase [Chthonomonadaceae bacterium]